MLYQVLLAILPIVVGDNICCAPKQWEGVQYGRGDFIKLPTYVRGKVSNMLVHYDATNRRMASSGFYSDEEGVHPFKIIDDYNHKKTYVIHAEESSCEIYSLTLDFEEYCISDESTLLGSSSVGFDANSIDVQGYWTELVDDEHSISSVTVVTKEDCIPYYRDIYGTYKNNVVLKIVNFAGITVGIKDATVFAPPLFCEESYDNGWQIRTKHDHGRGNDLQREQSTGRGQRPDFSLRFMKP